MKPVRVWSDMIDFGYTDVCILVSATIQSAWNYYRRLRDELPETVLGYNIFLVTPDTAYRTRGMTVTRFYVDQYTWRMHDSSQVERVINELYMCTIGAQL